MPCSIRKVCEISKSKKKNCSLVLWTIENGDARETEYIITQHTSANYNHLCNKT